MSKSDVYLIDRNTKAAAPEAAASLEREFMRTGEPAAAARTIPSESQMCR